LYVASKDGKISKLHKLFSSINNKSYWKLILKN
jgi:hypothetical protein